MELGTPRQQCGDHRRSHAAADITHEVDDARHAVAFIGRNTYITDQVMGTNRKPKPNDCNVRTQAAKRKEINRSRSEVE